MSENDGPLPRLSSTQAGEPGGFHRYAQSECSPGNKGPKSGTSLAPQSGGPPNPQRVSTGDWPQFLEMLINREVECKLRDLFLGAPGPPPSTPTPQYPKTLGDGHVVETSVSPRPSVGTRGPAWEPSRLLQT